jgi:hypothetical protein
MKLNCETERNGLAQEQHNQQILSEQLEISKVSRNSRNRDRENEMEKSSDQRLNRRRQETFEEEVDLVEQAI